MEILKLLVSHLHFIWKQEQTLFKDLRRNWQDIKKDIIDTKSSFIEAAEESKRSFKWK